MLDIQHNLVMKALLSLILLFLVNDHVSAAKIYQWVDEDGKKHFSQTPPPDNKQKKTVINTAASASSMRPEKKSDGVYCGTLRIAYNKDLSYSRNSTKYLAGKVSSWEKSLKRAEKQLNDYIKRSHDNRVVKKGEVRMRNSATYMATKERYTNSVNQYRCALGWAKNRDNKDIRSLEEDYLKAKKDHEIAVQQQQEICGEEPPDYNKYGPERDRYVAWEKCQRKYNAVVKKTKSKLRRTERDYRATQ